MRCPQCGVFFRPRSILTKFCSAACKQAAYRSRLLAGEVAVRVAGGPRRASVARIRREVNDRLATKRAGKVVTAAELKRARAAGRQGETSRRRR